MWFGIHTSNLWFSSILFVSQAFISSLKLILINSHVNCYPCGLQFLVFKFESTVLCDCILNGFPMTLHALVMLYWWNLELVGWMVMVNEMGVVDSHKFRDFVNVIMYTFKSHSKSNSLSQYFIYIYMYTECMCFYCGFGLSIIWSIKWVTC